MNQIESDMNNSSSTLLLAEESLEEIYSLYHRKVYGYFRRNGFDHEAAEDLAQEVFCRLLRFKDTFESNDQIRNWIFKVARNLLIDVLRKKENGAARPILMEDLPSFDTLVMDHVHVDGPEQTFVTEESNTEVMNLIEALNPRYADVIRLRELEGLKYQEIAKELGMTPKAVEGLLHRARAKLKTSYAAFQRGYQGAIAVFAVALRGLKRTVTRNGNVPAEGVKTAGKIAGVGKTAGAGSLLSGGGLLNGLLVVLVVGGITAGGMTIGLAETTPEVTPRLVKELSSPLGEQLSIDVTPEALGLTGIDPADLAALPTEFTLSGVLPLDELLAALAAGEIPGLQNTVHELLAGADGGVNALLGVVDDLVTGLGGAAGSLLDLLMGVPGLDLLAPALGQVAVTAGSLDGTTLTGPINQLQDQLFGTLEGVAGPVLGTLDGLVNQAQPITSDLTAPLAPATGTLNGILVPIGLVPPSTPAPAVPDDFAPMPEVQPGSDPAESPLTAPLPELVDTVDELLSPVLNGLLGF